MSQVRTSVVKNFELEGFLYGLLHSGSATHANKFGCVQTVTVTAVTTSVSENGDENSDFDSCCADVDGYVLLLTPNEQSAACVVTIGGVEVTIPAGTPAHRGIKIYDTGENSVYLPGAVTLTGGLIGLQFEIVYVPRFTASELLNFIDEFNSPQPEEWRWIKNKGKYDHRKRLADVERRLNGTFRFTNFTEGMHKFAGQLATLCLEIKDNHGGIVSEKEYYGHVMLKESDQNRPDGSEADMTSNYDGLYERWMTVVGE